MEGGRGEGERGAVGEWKDHNKGAGEKSAAGRRHTHTYTQEKRRTGHSVAGAGPHVLPDAGGGSGCWRVGWWGG